MPTCNLSRSASPEKAGVEGTDRASWEPRSMTNDDANSQESTECPTCGRDDFASEHGMKIHHQRTHGRSIAGVEVTCENCGDRFREKPFRANDDDRRSFCSRECMGEWRTEHLTGEDAPNWRGGLVEVTCEYCEDPFTVKRARAKSDNPRDAVTYCSRGCMNADLSDRYSGEDNPRWKGGYMKDRGTDWTELRQQTLEDDGHRCQGCGMTEAEHREEHGAGLSVHHIRPVTEFDEPADADTVDNLVALCRSCHKEWEGIPLRPTT